MAYSPRAVAMLAAALVVAAICAPRCVDGKAVEGSLQLTSETTEVRPTRVSVGFDEMRDLTHTHRDARSFT